MNVFRAERMGIPFNNADSQHVVSGGDYEARRIKEAIDNKIPCRTCGRMTNESDMKRQECSLCGDDFTAVRGAGQPTPTVCGKCLIKEESKKRRLHFSGLDGLTIEERLRKIEEWIYDYRPPTIPRF